MNAPRLIVNALLDSEAAEFMKSYKREHPARWEFDTGGGSGKILRVNRWEWDGKRTYIGCVRQSGDRWWTHAVEQRNFYSRVPRVDTGKHINSRDEYVSHVGPFDTKEQAAKKLWELYEAPR
jgi:hypothetical protein